jgi:hypothetical protein
VIGEIRQMKFVSQGYDCQLARGGVVFRDGDPTCGPCYLLDGSGLRIIPRMAYWTSILGTAADRILPQVGNYPGSVALHPAGDIATCNYQESTIRIFNRHGELKSRFNRQDLGCVYSVAWAGDCIWCAVPTDMAIYLYSATGSLLRTVGTPFQEDGPLDHPEHVSVQGGRLYICDMGHQRVASLNAEGDALCTYRSFAEPVWQWYAVPELGGEVVCLQSGIYLLNGSGYTR